MLMVLDRGHSLDSSGVEGHTVSRNNETIVFILLFLLVLIEDALSNASPCRGPAPRVDCGGSP